MTNPLKPGMPEQPTPEREPIPARDTIRRQNQRTPRHQDGGREADDDVIDKHGGDIQRDDVGKP